MVNADKPVRWKSDITQSVDCYNSWFMRFAPQTYRDTRLQTTKRVKSNLEQTAHLSDVTPLMLKGNPLVLQTLRMATAPPIARDRLTGLAGVSRNLVSSMEEGRIPPRLSAKLLDSQLLKISQVIVRLIDKDIFPWLDDRRQPTHAEIYRAATIIADRLCGAMSDPIIRNAQEQRQLAIIRQWLEERGYRYAAARFNEMEPGTFAFRINIPIKQENRIKQVMIPVDTVIMPLSATLGDFPLLIEAKSAGDFTNPNKRRKEEATKIGQLKNTYGDGLRYILFLCGYFDSGYLGYEAAEGIDWVWEHRIDDLAEFGV